MNDVSIPSVVRARGLGKRYGKTLALDGVDLDLKLGRIYGLIGPNGAGKTTALKAIMGLISVRGELEVLGLSPRRSRPRLMRELSFIADVAVLPRWLRVRDALNYMQGVHPRFRRDLAREFLGRTDIRMDHRVHQLSKGMVTQLHLALVMAVDARLLVLDEPTLGLDILYRQAFYEQLLNDYFDGERTIIVTTHQVEEIENILSDVLFINKGRIVLDTPTESIAERFAGIMLPRDKAEAARRLGPIHERTLFGQSAFVFEASDPSRSVADELCEHLGVDPQSIRVPGLADLFVAKLKGMAA